MGGEWESEGEDEGEGEGEGEGDLGADAVAGPVVAVADIAEAVVEAAGAALPEFDFVGDEGVAAPVGGAGDGFVGVLDFEFGGAGFEVGAIGYDLALGGGPGTDLMGAGAGGEVAFGFVVGEFPDEAAGGDLALACGPEEADGGAVVFGEFLAFAALVVGVEVEATVVEAFEEDDAGGGDAALADGGEGHGVGFGELMLEGVVQPVVEEDEGIAGGGGFVEGVEVVADA